MENMYFIDGVKIIINWENEVKKMRWDNEVGE